jgi:hypothetical protein
MMPIMNWEMAETVLLPIVIVATVFGTALGSLWIYLKIRNSERLAMIERGVDPAAFLPRVMPLRVALFFVGTGLGLLFGDLMAKYTVVDPVTSYISMTLVFAGLGIFFGFRLAGKQS